MQVVPDKVRAEKHARIQKQVVDAGIQLAYSTKGAGIAAVWAEGLRPFIQIVSGPDAQVETWAVSADGVFINADWTDGTGIGEKPMTTGEIVFLIYHETMHRALAHRLADRLLNIAQDAIINHVGVADGIGTFPGGKRRGIILQDFRDKGYNGPVESEALYLWLRQQEQQGEDPTEGTPAESGDEGDDNEGGGSPGNQPGDEGDESGQGEGEGEGDESGKGGGKGGKPTPSGSGSGKGKAPRPVGAGCAPSAQPGKPGSDAKAEDNARIAAERARVTIREASQKAGAGTALAELLAPKPVKSSIRSMVKRAFTKASETANSRTIDTYSRASRRGSVDPRFIKPGKTGTEAKVAFIGDISGSLGEEGAKQLIGMIDSVAREFPEVEVFLVTHTNEVCWQGNLKRGGDAESAKEACRNTGGTDFRPAYDAVRGKGKFDVAVHFTDGYNLGAWPESCAKELFIALFGPGTGITTPPAGARIIPVETK